MKKIPLLISAVILLLLILFSDPGRILKTLITADPLMIAAGLSLWFTGFLLRTARWRTLLRKCGISVDWILLSKVYLTGLMVSNFSPGKSGEPVRSIILKKLTGIKVSKSLPSIIIERVCDVLITILIAFSGILLLSSETVPLMIVSGLIYVTSVSVVLYILFSEERTRKFLEKLSKLVRFLPLLNKLSGSIRTFSRNLSRGVRGIFGSKEFLLSLTYTWFIWLVEASILYISFRSIGIAVPWLVCIVAVPVIALISILTFLPGGLGSSELLTVTIFTGLYALNFSDVVAATIIARFLSFWMYAFLGSVSFSTMKFRYKL